MHACKEASWHKSKLQHLASLARDWNHHKRRPHKVKLSSSALEFPRHSARDEQLGNELRKKKEDILIFHILGVGNQYSRRFWFLDKPTELQKDSGIFGSISATQVRTKMNASIKDVL